MNDTRGFLFCIISILYCSTKYCKNEETREKIGRVKASGKEVFVGFGIKDRQDVKLACEVADGAIIGTKAVMELEAGIDQFRRYIASLE